MFNIHVQNTEVVVEIRPNKKLELSVRKELVHLDARDIKIAVAKQQCLTGYNK